MATLGEKIKYFRKRAGKSQMEVEVSTGMAAGQLSRIENGEVNPTKETLDGIFNLFRLNWREISWINGELQRPATDKDVLDAIAQVQEYFKRKDVFAYLVDDRLRIFYASEGFKRMFKPFVSNIDILVQKVFGKSLYELILNPEFEVTQYLLSNNNKDFLEYQLARVKTECEFMYDDPFVQRLLELVNSNEISRNLWSNMRIENVNLNSLPSRIINFKLNNTNIKMTYSREPVRSMPRFETIEYIPTNFLVRFLSKL